MDNNDLTSKIERRKKLEKAISMGNYASSAKLVLDFICDGIVEDCKNEFENLPIFNYQNIDNRAVFMLKLKIEVAKTIKTRIKSMIAEGLKAEQELSGGEE